MKKLSTRTGFTLIELLVVIALLAVLITALIILIDPLQKIGQTNDAKRKSELGQLQRALEIYYQDNGKYPTSSFDYKITDADSTVKNWDTSWQPYMTKLPKDPSGLKYVYYTPAGGSCSGNNFQCYYIYASLQRKGNDKQACFPPGSATPGAACASFTTNAFPGDPTAACGSPTPATCNYGVSSSNTTP